MNNLASKCSRDVFMILEWNFANAGDESIWCPQIGLGHELMGKREAIMSSSMNS